MKALLGFASVAAVVVAVLLLHGAGHASSPFVVALANAAVKCPNITDATAHGLPAGSAPTATLSASCVLDLGIPKGDKGDTGPMGAQGPAGAPGTNGVSGYALATKTTTINGSKSNSYRLGAHRLRATAMCPPGKKAIGGGVSDVPAATLLLPYFEVDSSEPTRNGQGWTATARVRTGTVQLFTLKVTAVCAKVS